MLSFFPLAVLDEIWDLIESVSEGFLTYSWNFLKINICLISVSLMLENINNLVYSTTLAVMKETQHFFLPVLRQF